MVKVFLAGAEAFSQAMSETNGRALINYYYVKNKKGVLSFKKDNNIKELFLDSGAFTAWTKGAKIPIEEYCDFVKQIDCDFYSVLDVIGDDKATYNNQKTMEVLGCRPVPCFHYGDDIKYLEYYCADYDFVSLGGMVGKSTKELQRWLDMIFKKYPNQKFHGFGMTRVKLMERYPWYSVDSSSWIKWGSSKRIFSYHSGQFYLGENADVYNLQIKSNPKLKAFLDKYKLPTENFYGNYHAIMKANIYGFMEFEQNTKVADIEKQGTLF